MPPQSCQATKECNQSKKEKKQPQLCSNESNDEPNNDNNNHKKKRKQQQQQDQKKKKKARRTGGIKDSSGGSSSSSSSSSSRGKNNKGSSSHASSKLESCEFHDYACAKAFDIISKGMYKKFLAQSRNEGEDWACNVVKSVTKVQQVVSSIHKLMQEMPSWKKEEDRRSEGVDLAALYEACIEVMDAAVPPKKRRHTSSVCCITKVHLPAEEGVEILKKRDGASSSSTATSAAAAASSTQEIVVHPRFMHFFNMLWFVCRIDHVLRNIAKGWMVSNSSSNSAPRSQQQQQQQGEEEEEQGHQQASNQIALMQSMRQEETQVEGISMCQRFADQHAETIASMGIMFRHAYCHVYRSLSRLKRTS